MSTMAPVPSEHPIMQAWDEYKASPEFANTKRWASDDHHVVGSLWAAFVAGWNMRNGTGHSEPIEAAEALRPKMVEVGVVVFYSEDFPQSVDWAETVNLKVGTKLYAEPTK